VSAVIRTVALGKKYRRYATPSRRLAEWLTAGRYRGHEELWALRDVHLEVAVGETLGIVGQNGAGKSTLLKLLVGTTRPSEGSLEVRGPVSALLELGLGFHPEFTGRQNALIALQMMGMSPRQAEAALSEVADFSELGDFLQQPLRTYSSGMQVRLAFAVATVERPAVLIVDEALTVGDAYFQHKCIRRIREFRSQGTTMLFVSHDPAAVKTLCDRAILLDQGRVLRAGSAEAILDYYNALIAQRERDHSIQQHWLDQQRARTRSGDGRARFAEVALTDAEGRTSGSFVTGQRARVTCRIELYADLEDYAVGILIRDRLGNEVFGANTGYLEVPPVPGSAGDQLEAVFDLELNLGYGHYSLSAAIHATGGHLEENHDWIDNAASFQVIPGSRYRFAGVAHLPVSARLARASDLP
jgi:lipopolysaccharide transport system ATP-binding protein